MARVHFVAGWLLTSALLMPDPALAYIGPGAGITMLGPVGVVVAIVVALGAVLYLPIRAVLLKRKGRQQRPTPSVQQRPTHSTDRRTTSGLS